MTMTVLFCFYVKFCVCIYFDWISIAVEMSKPLFPQRSHIFQVICLSHTGMIHVNSNSFYLNLFDFIENSHFMKSSYEWDNRAQIKHSCV